jgi:hypothetical protein
MDASIRALDTPLRGYSISTRHERKVRSANSENQGIIGEGGGPPALLYSAAIAAPVLASTFSP